MLLTDESATQLLPLTIRTKPQTRQGRLKSCQAVFRRPFFTHPTLTGIAQALRHAVDGEVHHLQQVGVARVFAQAFE